uniref:Uncharacterized protein n=1 Tax=Candidatus Methanogaster sp. ANME-2c ERB4 TaxID=2759911 RepID=A0A7G9YMD0_9EURY|nr:hypothetical protein CDCKMDEO_00009 [Methanosarcinales archaeon ANME-2c ERB4]
MHIECGRAGFLKVPDNFSVLRTIYMEMFIESPKNISLRVTQRLCLRHICNLTFGELKLPVLLSSQNTCRIANDNNAIEE